MADVIDFRSGVSLDGVSLSDIELGKEIQKAILSKDVNKLNDMAISEKLKARFEQEDMVLGHVKYSDLMDTVQKEDFEEMDRLLFETCDWLFS